MAGFLYCPRKLLTISMATKPFGNKNRCSVWLPKSNLRHIGTRGFGLQWILFVTSSISRPFGVLIARLGKYGHRSNLLARQASIHYRSYGIQRRVAFLV